MFVYKSQKLLPNVRCYGLTEWGVVPGDFPGPLPGANLPLAVLGLLFRLGFLKAYVVLVAAFFRAPWYRGAASSNAALLWEIEQSRFSTPAGSCLMTAGGWLERRCT